MCLTDRTTIAKFNNDVHQSANSRPQRDLNTWFRIQWTIKESVVVALNPYNECCNRKSIQFYPLLLVECSSPDFQNN